MTAQYSTTSTIPIEEPYYSFSCIPESSGFFYSVAEDPQQYTDLISNDALPQELRKIELQSLQGMVSAQIGRLYQLANLLLQPEPVDRSADALAQYALEVRHVTNLLEDMFNTMNNSFIDNPPSERD